MAKDIQDRPRQLSRETSRTTARSPVVAGNTQGVVDNKVVAEAIYKANQKLQTISLDNLNELEHHGNILDHVLTNTVDTVDGLNDVSTAIESSGFEITTAIDNGIKASNIQHKALIESINKTALNQDFADSLRDLADSIKRSVKTGGSATPERQKSREQLATEHRIRRQFGSSKDAAGNDYQVATDDKMDSLSPKEVQRLKDKVKTEAELRAQAEADVSKTSADKRGMFERIGSRLKNQQMRGGIGGAVAGALLPPENRKHIEIDLTGGKLGGGKSGKMLRQMIAQSRTKEPSIRSKRAEDKRQEAITERVSQLRETNNVRSVFERQTEKTQQRQAVVAKGSDAARQVGKAGRRVAEQSLEKLKEIATDTSKSRKVLDFLGLLMPLATAAMTAMKGLMGGVISAITSLGSKLLGKLMRTKSNIGGTDGNGENSLDLPDKDKDSDKKRDKNTDSRDKKTNTRSASKPDTQGIDLDIEIPDSDGGDSGKKTDSGGKKGDVNTGGKKAGGKGKKGAFNKFASKLGKVFKRNPMLGFMAKKMPSLIAKRAATAMIPVIGTGIAAGLLLWDAKNLYDEAVDSGIIGSDTIPNMFKLDNTGSTGGTLANTEKLDAQTRRTNQAVDDAKVDKMVKATTTGNTQINVPHIVNNNSQNNYGSPFRFNNDSYLSHGNRGAVIIR